MKGHTYSLRGIESDGRLLFSMFTLSLICHLLIGAAIIIGVKFLPEKTYLPALPSVINVSMVSFPGEKPGPPPAKQPEVKPEEKTPEPKEEKVEEKAVESEPPVKVEEKPPEPIKKEPELPKPEEKIVEPPKPEEKVVIPEAPKEKPKEKPREPEKPKEKPEKPKEKPPEPEKPKEKKAEPESRPKSVTDAINRIRKQIKSEESVAKAINKIRKKVAVEGVEGGTGDGTGAIGGIGRLGSQDSAALNFYGNNIVGDRIQKNWVFSEYMAGNRSNLKAILVIKILANGEIADVRFEKKSGNAYLDESAYKAIMKSNPFPPLPKGYSAINAAVGFTPSGVE